MEKLCTKRKSIMLKIKRSYKKDTFKRKYYNYAKKLKIKRIVHYLRRELQDSTAHGLSYVVKTEIHWFERFFWAACFIFANVLIYVFLSSQYTRFMQAPVVTSVEKDYFNWNVSYPSIILCPEQKIDEESLMTLVNETMVKTGKNIEAYLRIITSVSLDTLYNLRVPNEDMLSLLDSKDYARICSELFKKMENTSLTIATKWPITIEETMTEMGMCHSINSNVAVFDNPPKWNDRGITYQKNNIDFSFHDRDFYIEIKGYADKYKIYTSSPDDIVLSGAQSISFNTEGFLSFEVHISTTKTSSDIRSMPLSLRQCRFLDEPDSDRYPIYSYNRCLMECRIKIILKLCGCIPHLYKPLENKKICNLAELGCILNYNHEIMTLTVSNETLEQFDDISSIPKTSRDCGCLANCESDVYQNDNAIFLSQESMNRLKIRVAAFPKVRYVRQIIFSFYDLFLKAGGVINLCIGTSIISTMELLLTVLKIPIYGISRSIQKCQKFARVMSKQECMKREIKTK